PDPFGAAGHGRSDQVGSALSCGVTGLSVLRVRFSLATSPPIALLESRQPSCVPKRRDGRVAEGARLESVYRGNSIQGSNPCLSASYFCSFPSLPSRILGAVLLLLRQGHTCDKLFARDHSRLRGARMIRLGAA